MAEERILNEPSIAPNAVKYQVLSACVATAASIIGIPLLLLVVPFAQWYWSRYYGHLRVVLTARELKVNRGILNREEKSIPLEKITDLAVYQGPIMRWLDLKGIRVETAGQSAAGGALVKLVGISGTDAFRDHVLSQRDRITDGDAQPPAIPTPSAEAEDAGLLELTTEIRDTLVRIEAALKQR